MNDLVDAFSDPDHVARYVDGPARFVPGLAHLHQMTSILLAERAPQDACVLVLGAGGGLELRALAEAHPGWSFDGVDPSAEMIGVAEQVIGPLESQVTLYQGYIDDAPDKKYDAGTCLLTLHFLDADERLRTLIELRCRLKDGAPFVAAHSSFPQQSGERSDWIARYAAFATGQGVDSEEVERARTGVETQLDTLDPAQDEEILREAGFSDVRMFYAAFTWRGWVGYA